MQATCGNDGCGRSWTLQKSPEEYADGPRCPDCGNRDVDVSGTPAGNGDAASVFDALADGSTPLDLVREQGIEPARARELADEFDALSEYVVISEAELADRIEAARAEVREAEEEKRSRAVRRAREQEHQRAQQDLANAQHQARREGHRRGFSEGWNAAEEDLKADLEAALEERVADLQKDQRGRLKAIRAEAAKVVESAEGRIDEQKETIEALRYQRDELLRRLELFSGSNEARIWADGYEFGVASPTLNDEARRQGMVDVLESMAA